MGHEMEDAFAMPEYTHDACIPPAAPQEDEPWDMDAELNAPPKRYTKEMLLDAAKESVDRRGKNYGTPYTNFMRIANHWEMFLANSKRAEITITPGDVAIMFALMKIARLENDPGHADSWIDLAGYAACGAEIETAK